MLDDDLAGEPPFALAKPIADAPGGSADGFVAARASLATSFIDTASATSTSKSVKPDDRGARLDGLTGPIADTSRTERPPRADRQETRISTRFLPSIGTFEVTCQLRL